MDFSQYFWSVPSRLDELSGGIQRQETFLETFLVNSLQVEIQKLNSYNKKHDPVALYLILNLVLNCITSCRCTIIYRLSHLPSSFLDPLHLWRSQVPLHGSLFFKWIYIGGWKWRNKCAPKSKLWASEWQSHVLSCPKTVPGQLKIQSTWLVSISDTFFWGSDIISRTTRWLLVNTGTTFNLLLPLLLILLGLGLGQNSPFSWYVAKNES